MLSAASPRASRRAKTRASPTENRTCSIPATPALFLFTAPRNCHRAVPLPLDKRGARASAGGRLGAGAEPAGSPTCSSWRSGSGPTSSTRWGSDPSRLPHPSSSWRRRFPDDEIPGTMMTGHTPPVIIQAFIFMAIIIVDPVHPLHADCGGGAGCVAGRGRGDPAAAPLDSDRDGGSVADRGRDVSCGPSSAPIRWVGLATGLTGGRPVDRCRLPVRAGRADDHRHRHVRAHHDRG